MLACVRNLQPEELRCKYSLHLRKNICTPNPKTTNVLCIILCYAHFNVLQYIPYCNILPFVNTQHESCGSLRLGSYLFTLFLHYGAQVVFTHHLAIRGLLRRLYWLPSEVGVQAHGRRRPAALLLFFLTGRWTGVSRGRGCCARQTRSDGSDNPGRRVPLSRQHSGKEINRLPLPIIASTRRASSYLSVPCCWR